MRWRAAFETAAALIAAASMTNASAQSAAAAAAAPKFVAGQHYQEIKPIQPTSVAPGKVEVLEIFMFGCPGCFALEPHLQQWLRSKPDYVELVRVPAVWNAIAEMHARAYYTAQELGKTDLVEGPFFDAYHVQGNHLDSDAKLAEFFGRYGVDAATFQKTFYSPAVEAKLKQSNELVQRYKIQRTPTIVVNGKYVTNGTMAGTYDTWFAIIDELAAREHATHSP